MDTFSEGPSRVRDRVGNWYSERDDSAQNERPRSNGRISRIGHFMGGARDRVNPRATMILFQQEIRSRPTKSSTQPQKAKTWCSGRYGACGICYWE